ncbi:uncharacterized protein EV420DRAFT_1252593, partial [Desarmillaria tabescens]
MGNPGVFQGTRFDFLTSELPGYGVAVKEDRARAYCISVCRRYHKRYHPLLPHNEEPTAEALALVNDDVAD